MAVDNEIYIIEEKSGNGFLEFGEQLLNSYRSLQDNPIIKDSKISKRINALESDTQSSDRNKILDDLYEFHSAVNSALACKIEIFMNSCSEEHDQFDIDLYAEYNRVYELYEERIQLLSGTMSYLEPKMDPEFEENSGITEDYYYLYKYHKENDKYVSEVIRIETLNSLNEQLLAIEYLNDCFDIDNLAEEINHMSVISQMIRFLIE